MKADILAALLKARTNKVPAALVTELTGGAQALVASGTPKGELPIDGALRDAVADALAADKGATVELGGKRYFINVFNPPRRLIIVGAVHIGQALAPLAALSGYAVTVVDPRGAFATAERFPGVTLRGDWPDDALAALDIDRRTAVVTLTHDPKLDDPALTVALRREPFYIGALGSRKTHAKRLERLREAGIDEAALARVNGPVGLDIGAVSPAEIAISILAEMTRALHATPARAAA